MASRAPERSCIPEAFVWASSACESSCSCTAFVPRESGASRSPPTAIMISPNLPNLPNLPNSLNLLDREFVVAVPDKVWVGDITYIATDEGWLFLAVVIDLFSRHVVGWSLRGDMTRGIVIDAFRMAWFKRHPSKQAGLTFHSDRGSQYASKDFQGVLKGYGITSSMSRRGNCWDNACSETLSGSLKVERLYGQKFKTRREAKDETIAWLLRYNRARPHLTLACISPVQSEQNWLASQPNQASL